MNASIINISIASQLLIGSAQCIPICGLWVPSITMCSFFSGIGIVAVDNEFPSNQSICSFLEDV